MQEFTNNNNNIDLDIDLDDSLVEYDYINEYRECEEVVNDTCGDDQQSIIDCLKNHPEIWNKIIPENNNLTKKYFDCSQDNNNYDTACFKTYLSMIYMIYMLNKLT